MSIFYLPLAFCAGIWSINENYDRVSYVITSVLVAIGTYFVVGNLENFIGALKAVYNTFKRPLVDRMASDDATEWSEIGQAFKSFQPRREIVKPSEWHVSRYWVVEILRKLRALQEHWNKFRENSPGEHTSPPGEDQDTTRRNETAQRGLASISAPNADAIRTLPLPQSQSKLQPKTKLMKETEATPDSLV